MLRKVLLGLGAIIIIFAVYVAYVILTTKSHSPEDVAVYKQDGLEISVRYCQPFKKDRLIFGEGSKGALVTYGKKWRTGANEASEISLNKDLTIGGQLLKAGSYSVYTIPGVNEWTIVFNSKLDYWGASPGGDPYEENLDVLRVTVPSSTVNQVLEQFTIDFQGQGNQVEMRLRWDQTEVVVPIEAT